MFRTMDSFNLESLFGGRKTHKTHKTSKTKKSTTRRHKGGEIGDLPTEPEKLTESLEKIKDAVINKKYVEADVAKIIAVLEVALKKNVEPEPVVPATPEPPKPEPKPSEPSEPSKPQPGDEEYNIFNEGGKRKSSKAKSQKRK